MAEDRKKILVVDDEEHVVAAIMTNLELDGYEVVPAYSGPALDLHAADQRGHVGEGRVGRLHRRMFGDAAARYRRPESQPVLRIVAQFVQFRNALDIDDKRGFNAPGSHLDKQIGASGQRPRSRACRQRSHRLGEGDWRTVVKPLHGILLGMTTRYTCIRMQMPPDENFARRSKDYLQ